MTLVLDDRSVAKACDARITKAIYKDVRLVRCQYGGETRFKNTKYPSDAPMNHTAGVKVTEALSDVG